MSGHRDIKCFMDLLTLSLSSLDMLAFKYVTILYTLLLLLSVIWIMNKCGGGCCREYYQITTIKSSVVHGILSLLVMCYTQCVHVSMTLLNPVYFNVELEVEFNPPAIVWLNGDIVYFSKEHLKYALWVLVCLLTIGISLQPCYCYPLLNRVPELFGCNYVKINCLFCHKLSLIVILNLRSIPFKATSRTAWGSFAGLYFL